MSKHEDHRPETSVSPDVRKPADTARPTTAAGKNENKIVGSKDHWRLETLPSERRRCADCGKFNDVMFGAVLQGDGVPFAMFQWFKGEHGGRRDIFINMVLLLKDDNGQELQKSAVGLRLWEDNDGAVATTVEDNPLPNGRGMTQTEALASPRLPLIFDIDDFIVDNDPRIKSFLLHKD